MRSWDSGSDFRVAVEQDTEIRKVLSLQQIADAFSLDRQLRNSDKIFNRVFNS
jgi:hypothetical protein